MRLFAALAPPPAVVAHLDRALTAVRDDDLRWTDPASWHVTLAFYGEVAVDVVPDLGERLARAGRRCPPMSLRLSGAGRFGRAVLWTGADGDGVVLRRLAASATAAGRRVGVPADPHARYRPHVTLARSRGESDLRPYVDALAGYRGPPWNVPELALIESRPGAGPGRRSTYVTVDTFPLGGLRRSPR